MKSITAAVFGFLLLCKGSGHANDAESARTDAHRMSLQLGVCSSFLEAELNGDWKKCYELLDASITSRFTDTADIQARLTTTNFSRDGDVAKASEISDHGKNHEMAFIKYWSAKPCPTVVFFVLRKDQSAGNYKVLFSYPSQFSLIFSSEFTRSKFPGQTD